MGRFVRFRKTAPGGRPAFGQNHPHDFRHPRPGMTRERFDAILARQLPDAEKRRRADFVIDTSVGLEAARARVAEIVGMVLADGWTPPRRGLPKADEPPH